MPNPKSNKLMAQFKEIQGVVRSLRQIRGDVEAMSTDPVEWEIKNAVEKIDQCLGYMFGLMKKIAHEYGEKEMGITP